MRIISKILLAITMVLCAGDTFAGHRPLNDFVRGVWLTYYEGPEDKFYCVPGMHRWDSLTVNYQREYSLLSGIHVNVINYYMQFERQYLDSVCNAYSNGAIKMYIGMDTPKKRTLYGSNPDGYNRTDSLNFEFWTWWKLGGARWEEYPNS